MESAVLLAGAAVIMLGSSACSADSNGSGPHDSSTCCGGGAAGGGTGGGGTGGGETTGGTAGMGGSGGTGTGSDLLFDADYSLISLGASEKVDAKGLLYDQVLVPGGGPSGQSSLQLAQISALGQPEYGGQFRWGHDLGITDPGEYFIRFRLRVDSADANRTNFRAASWNDGSVVRSRNKFIVVGSSSRWIINLDGRLSAETDGGHSYTAGQWNWEVIQDGTGPVMSPGYDPGTWYDVQIEVHHGASPSVRIWMDDMTYANPVLTRTGPSVPESSGFIAFGAFCNDGLQADGQYRFIHTDLEVGASYDPTW